MKGSPADLAAAAATESQIGGGGGEGYDCLIIHLAVSISIYIVAMNEEQRDLQGGWSWEFNSHTQQPSNVSSLVYWRTDPTAPHPPRLKKGGSDLTTTFYLA
jgi:hypothetical protein